MSVDINSKGWRTQVANEVYLKVCEKRREILKSILPQIDTVCRNTEKDIDILAKKLKRFQESIPLFHQEEAVKTWEKREFLKNLPGLTKYPRILKYIAGHKYKNPTIKVFLSFDDIEARLFFTQNSKIPGETRFEFVDIAERSKKSMRTTDRTQELKSDVRKELGQTLKNQAEKVYANYSSVVGLGIGTTNSDGSDTPYIIIFCLDKDLIQYGEKPLPKYLDGWRCELREDIVLFGGCLDCHQIAQPNPGCCIGLPSNGFGSASFLVKNKGTRLQASGFLTAAHVAAENWTDLYNSNTLLSELGAENVGQTIVHSSVPNVDAGLVIGNVMESFCGNWEGTGIDAAFVQIAEQTGGEYMELQIADERSLKYDRTIRVIKRGCRTCETEGFLVNGDYSVCLDEDPNNPKGCFFFFNQCFAIEDIYRSFFDLGDSGSGVFVLENGKPTRPLGIAFAKHMVTKTTAVCRIDLVIRAFNLCIYEKEETMDS